MSTPINDGGSAFPVTAEQSSSGCFASSGMTLRDYLAGQALAGVLMNYTTQKFGASEFTVACAAYQYADAMLQAREAKP